MTVASQRKKIIRLKVSGQVGPIPMWQSFARHKVRLLDGVHDLAAGFAGIDDQGRVWVYKSGAVRT